MTDYWVSKKQYWCKYCDIWIRDDAPSRKHHETGLKHQGNKERFIRDLYKQGNIAKREKANAEAEMARIESAAQNAYAKDMGLSSSHQAPRLHPSAYSASSSKRDFKPKDKWANYTSAKDMGFDDEETSKSMYEIEQEIKGRAAREPGAWETVEEQVAQADLYLAEADAAASGKRKLGEYAVQDENDAENFQFQHKEKRPTRDPYDDDDWDPKKAIGAMKFKSKDAKDKEDAERKAKEKLAEENGLNREAWTGKLEMKREGSPSNTQQGLEHAGGGLNKADGVADGVKTEAEPAAEDVKPELKATETDAPKASEPVLEDAKPEPEPATEAPATSSLFKKRRPPPGGRKK